MGEKEGRLDYRRERGSVGRRGGADLRYGGRRVGRGNHPPNYWQGAGGSGGWGGGEGLFFLGAPSERMYGPDSSSFPS